MHMCAGVHSAMSELTDLEHSSDDRQHVETGKSRNNRDFTDSLKLLEWFRNNNPFDRDNNALHSFASGVAASD